MKYLGLVFIFFSIQLSSQILEVDTIVSENKVTSYQNQKLFLIDFWATWCMPCRPATKQLEIIQSIYPNDIFMIALSDESYEKVLTYQSERPIKLLTASDFQNSNFDKYKITNRPTAVLLDYTGKKLWQGKPGDLSYDILDKFIEKYKYEKNEKSLSELIHQNIKQVKNELNSDSLFPKILVNDESSPVTFEGDIREFVSEYMSIPLSLIRETNFKCKIYIPKKILNSFSKSEICDSILHILRYKMDSFPSEIKLNLCKVVNEKMLWDTAQIQWQSGSPQYMIGEYRIEGDNLTISEIFLRLSNLKKQVFLYEGKNENKYDWSFMHSIDHLMKEELISSFGIQIESKTKKIMKYKLSLE